MGLLTPRTRHGLMIVGDELNACSAGRFAVPTQLSSQSCVETAASDTDWCSVPVPEGLVPGNSVNCELPDGRMALVPIPSGLRAGDTFMIRVANNVVMQVVNVTLPGGAHPGATIPLHDSSGRCMGLIELPSGACPGHTIDALMPVAKLPPRALPLRTEEIDPWLAAAREFELNADFLLPLLQLNKQLDFHQLMALMKSESANKRTIQAFGDKILLNGLVENLGVKQMPMLLKVQNPGKVQTQVEEFVDQRIQSMASDDVILKPTHLSNGAGVLTMGPVNKFQRDDTIHYLHEYILNFLGQQAQETESEALRSVLAGYVTQPKYNSVVGFGAPLEIRAVVIFGRVRLGVWWWGTADGGPESTPHRNVWLARKQKVTTRLGADDTWEPIHCHPGGNPGFDAALKVLIQSMPEIVEASECVARAFGAPFLRVDFFVGSPEWGVRLNEVAYGSGIEFRRLDFNGTIVDDSLAIAQILQEGMGLCKKTTSPGDFLSRLGVEGDTYPEMTITKISQNELYNPMSHSTSRGVLGGCYLSDCAVSAEHCCTPRASACPVLPQHTQQPSSLLNEHIIHIEVPAGVAAGSLVSFVDTRGVEHMAQIPPGLQAGELFMVQVLENTVMQPVCVAVPAGKVPGDTVLVEGLDGKPTTFQVPAGATAGESIVLWSTAPQQLPASPSTRIPSKHRSRDNYRLTKWLRSSMPPWVAEVGQRGCHFQF